MSDEKPKLEIIPGGRVTAPLQQRLEQEFLADLPAYRQDMKGVLDLNDLVNRRAFKDVYLRYRRNDRITADDLTDLNLGSQAGAVLAILKRHAVGQNPLNAA